MGRGNKSSCCHWHADWSTGLKNATKRSVSISVRKKKRRKTTNCHLSGSSLLIASSSSDDPAFGMERKDTLFDALVLRAVSAQLLLSRASAGARTRIEVSASTRLWARKGGNLLEPPFLYFESTKFTRASICIPDINCLLFIIPLTLTQPNSSWI